MNNGERLNNTCSQADRSRRGHERGFTYLMALIAVAAIALGLTGFIEIWSTTKQREREQDLLWIGNQFRQAIGLYYQRSPGTVKRYPERLEDLLEDRRFLNIQRYLRRVYEDPMTGKPAWGLVSAPQGGVMGIHSLAEKAPIKSGGFSLADDAFGKAGRYADWRFIYEPPPEPQMPGKRIPQGSSAVRF